MLDAAWGDSRERVISSRAKSLRVLFCCVRVALLFSRKIIGRKVIKFTRGVFTGIDDEKSMTNGVGLNYVSIRIVGIRHLKKSSTELRPQVS